MAQEGRTSLESTNPALRAPGDPDDIGRQLKRVTFILAKRKWWILLTFLVAIAATALYTKRMVPVYRASAAIIIERAPPKVLSGVKEVVELGSSNSYFAQQEYYQTQYKIIRGLDVCDRVVARLHLDEDPDFLGLPAGKTPTDEEKRDLIANKVPSRTLQGRMNVEPVRDSMMVLVTFDDRDPRRATEIANEIVLAYRAQNIEYRRAITQEANAELRTMVDRYRERKEAADQELLEFERKHRIGSFQSEKASLEDRLKLLNDRQGQLLVLKADLDARMSRIKRIEAAQDPTMIPLETLLNNGLIASLKGKLTELRDQRKALSYVYDSKHHKIEALDGQIAQILDAIRAEVKTHLASARGEHEQVVSALREVGRLIDAANRSLVELGSLQVEFNALAEKKKDSTEVYDQVRSRYTEISLSAQVETNNVRIHELAQIPSRPVRPDLRINLALAGAIGLLIGLGLAFLVEQLDNSVKTRDEVERLTGVPCLGMVPSIPGPRKRGRRSKDVTLKQRDFYVFENPKSVISEAIATIRTNLLFIDSTKTIRTLLVTSGGPWEGKSTVSIALSVTFARNGTRTLLIDTDMRRPRLHRTFGMEADVGLSSLLLGTAKIEESVRGTSVPGLDILPCGPVPPNPSELLRMDKLGRLLEQLHTRYDMVVLDSPPVIPVADPRILSSMVDGVVLVVKLGHTTLDALAQVHRELTAVGAPLLGTILNDLDVRRPGYYGYGYYGYGHYGYGHYGYHSTEAPAKSDGPQD